MIKERKRPLCTSSLKSPPHEGVKNLNATVERNLNSLCSIQARMWNLNSVLEKQTLEMVK